MRVLVAEDDPVCRRTLKSSLSKAGYEVVEAGDGLEAWAVLQRPDAPRLVILDWMMPGMDGVEICKKVRQRAERFYVYILMLTARRQKQDILEGLEAGVDDYLTKPFVPQELSVRLRAGRRILDLQERLVTACERLQKCALDDLAARQRHRNQFVDFLRAQVDFS
jgi:DNA-binding response OmpR family regulator